MFRTAFLRRLALAAALMATAAGSAAAQLPGSPAPAAPASSGSPVGPIIQTWRRAEPVATDETAPAFRKQDDSPRFNLSFTLLGLLLVVLLILIL